MMRFAIDSLRHLLTQSTNDSIASMVESIVGGTRGAGIPKMLWLATVGATNDDGASVRKC